jgi:hypothetical protein
VDPLLVLMIMGLCSLWAWTGYEICQARHKQNGLDVDPWDFLIPDYPPDSWGAPLPDDTGPARVP